MASSTQHESSDHNIDSLPDTFHGYSKATIRAWFEEVKDARSKAYCPYSNFPVGAIVIPKPSTNSQPSIHLESKIYHGANIENAAYPVGTCAERVAIGNAVVNGRVRPGDIAAICVITKNEEPASPCGMCRQFIFEFCGKDTPVFMFGAEGKVLVRGVGELLVLGFGGADLGGR